MLRFSPGEVAEAREHALIGILVALEQVLLHNRRSYPYGKCLECVGNITFLVDEPDSIVLEDLHVVGNLP